MTNLSRRSVVLALGAAATSPGTAHAMTFDPIPPLPATPPSGAPGDFAFLTGEWRIANRSIVDGAWLDYPGEASVHAILGGVGSVEELRIPARNFSGMGLRLLDMTSRIWSDFWVNARSGALTMPGQTGGFINGAGVFVSDYVDAGRPMKSVGVWDQIAPASCRWRQATSADGGRSWEHNWIMHWTRV
jgi:hypothetical protein